MPEDLTLEILKALNVVAVSLANNHSHDHGLYGYERTKGILKEHGIVVLEQGKITSFPDFDLVAWTDVDNSHPRKRNLLTRDNLKESLIKPKQSTIIDLSTYRLPRRYAPRNDSMSQRLPNSTQPLWAFMHWGQEGWPKPGTREKWLAEELQNQGISLIVGHHPHRAGELTGNTQGLTAWSLGNFLFDQEAPQADGALLEVSIFPQGSFWVRQLPMGNVVKKTLVQKEDLAP